jgi:hypothetical protein
MMRVRRQETVQQLPAIIGWLLVGVPVVTLMLRFGMRAVGVRPDVPLPSFVYGVTTWLVTPFYSFLPADVRFDRSALEVAALAAAGSIFLAAVAIYLLFVIVSGTRNRQHTSLTPNP